MLNNKLEKGMLLIAEPSIIGDLSFNRAVILLTDYTTHSGAVGFILNKPLEYTLQELIPDVNCDFTIYNGGPVEQDNLYFIHTIPELIPESIEIADGLYWGGNFEQIKWLINQNKIEKHQIRFFLGYSGWASSQLEEELTEKTWFVCENQYKSRIFQKPASDFWQEKMKDMGGEYMIWVNAPENPILN
ncbi:YqgE/AlgH family protein [Flavobacterium croceum]|uniref:YqgE/AlgH family protein n=1 Tax=Flavobacterium croceum TaxID=370975 RepID=UPI0024A7A80C|nr:YqgE/AlgH family protein [Flavobacterium croceum]